MVSFRRADRERVANGEITVTFRLWTRPQAKAGNTYRSAVGVIEVEDVRVMPAGLVTKKDAALAGCRTIADVWESAGEHTGTRVVPDTMLYRVQFRFLGDARPATSATAAAPDTDRLLEKLRRMDERSSRGPWTSTFLELIDAAPHVPARVLAAELGWEKLAFKEHVRRLKALGLTISHEVGYELSDAGRRVMEAARTDVAARTTRETASAG